jgi:hypothetical protein
MARNGWQEDRKQESIDYIGRPEINILVNTEEIAIANFNTKASNVLKSAKFFTMQFDEEKPNWFDGFFVPNMFEDEKGLWNWGFGSELDFFSIDIDKI